MSAVLEYFHAKDLKNHMHLATDPPSENMSFQGASPEAKIWVKNVHRERIFKDLHHIFTIFQKQQVYKLVAWHSVPRYELVDLLFFNS